MPVVQDHVLISSAQRGDRVAFGQLIDRHQSAIYGYLRARLLEPADAEDLSQEVFLRCYRARGRFDSAEMVRPWLVGIARNVLREHVRKAKRRKEIAWTELCLELDAMISSEDPHYDQALQHLPGCLDSLGQTARAALAMRYESNLKLADIGDRLRRSEGAAKLLVHRARQALKHCLNGKLANGSAD